MGPLSFQLDHGVRTTELTANTLIHPNNVEMMEKKGGPHRDSHGCHNVHSLTTLIPLWSLSEYISGPTLVPL